MLRDLRDGVRYAIYAVLITGFLILLGVGGTALYQHFAVGIENRNTSIVRETNSYVTSKQTHLTQLYSDYRDLDTKIAAFSKNPDNTDEVNGFHQQQQAIIREMRVDVATIEPNQVPPDVQRLLAQNR